MIKKLILLLLVVCGGVVSANADGTVKKRIFIQHKLQGTKYLYMYRTNDEKKVLGDWPGTEMIGYNNGYDDWYYIDVELDENTIYTLIVNNNNGTQSDGISFNSSENKFYSVWGGGSNYNSNDLTYYLYNTNDGSTTEMSLDNNLKLSVTIDNTAGNSIYYTIAPSFVTSWYSTDNKKWNLMIRPFEDYEQLKFANITSDQEYAKVLVGTGNSNAWNTNGINAYFDLEVDLSAWTYSISPFFTRTLPAAAEGYGTFSSQYDVTVPEGLTAKYASAVAGGKITWEEFGANGIPAGQGALLEGTAGKDYKFTPATSAEAPSVNHMKAINEKIKLPQTEDSNTNYILTKSTVNGEDALGFYKVNAEGSWCAAGTAYLSVLSQHAPEFIVLGETTGIANVNRENVSDNQYYMLDGRRVAQPTKGLYIVNGKKVIIK